MLLVKISVRKTRHLKENHQREGIERDGSEGGIVTEREKEKKEVESF